MSLNENVPSVSVAISTYNGEKYIADQLDSILNQKNVTVSIFVRDDGSKDSTAQILSKYEARYPNIFFERGENIGFANSFMHALNCVPKSDYYAFSDQDDIWLPDKLINTINLIEYQDIPALAFMNAQETDENLNPTNVLYPDDRLIPCSKMSFISPVCHGFLMVFNQKLKNLIDMTQCEIPISHDMWVGMLADFFGIIKWNNQISAYHRRLSESVSRKILSKELRHRFKSMFWNQSKIDEVCTILLRYYQDQMPPEILEDVLLLKNYRTDRTSKLILMKDKNMRYPGKFGDIVIKTKILLNKF